MPTIAVKEYEDEFGNTKEEFLSTKAIQRVVKVVLNDVIDNVLLDWIEWSRICTLDLLNCIDQTEPEDVETEDDSN